MSDEKMIRPDEGLVLLGERAGLSREDIFRSREDLASGIAVTRRWVPIGYALVETKASLSLRIWYWFAVPGAFFDGTAAQMKKMRFHKTAPESAMLKRIYFKVDEGVRLFRHFKNRLAELAIRDEVLGLTVSGNMGGGYAFGGSQVHLVETPAEAVDQLSAWNEQLEGFPAGPYPDCSYAIGPAVSGGGAAAFEWVPVEVYEALLAAAPPRSLVVIDDDVAYSEESCPHEDQPYRGRYQHRRAEPVELGLNQINQVGEAHD